MYSKSVVQENCLSCAVGPSVAFPTFLGFPCIRLKCFHSDEKIKQRVYYSRLSKCIATCLSSYLFLYFCYSIYRISISFSVGNETNLINLIIIGLVCLRTSTSLFNGIIRTSTGYCMVAEINTALQMSDSIGYGILLPKKDVKHLRSLAVLFSFLSFALLSTYAVYIFMLKSSPEFSLIEKITSFLCFCVDDSVLLMFWSNTTVHDTVYYRHRQQIRALLLRRYRRKRSLCKAREELSNFSDTKNFLIFLKFAKDLNTKLSLVHKKFNRFCDLCVIVMLITTTAVTVANALFFLIMLRKGTINPFKPEFVGLEGQSLASLALVYCLYKLEKLQNAVSV